ncbi:PI-PLC X domain-containing protein 1 [Crotalus adamanteus]|uniref:PI-PLC X domain-containing protein 1 n=1 Tax=Crotalus adamanteus TaxID=8729 RepID=A0AAW1BIS5_CROAD
MSDLPESLWAVPLSNLSLPGSHDAMTYCLDKESEVSANGSKLLQLLDKHMHCIVHPIILRWSITQDLTVLEQLDAGIRYFDFRIAHKSDDPSMKLYFVHMLYTTVEVEVVLWDILRWLKNHPWEVVVLAFRNFDGLDENHHNHLVSCIKKIFSSRLCPRNIVPTLWNMWSSGYQVILSYDKIEQLIKHSELWPEIPYWWGNKDTAQKLIEFLAKRKQSGRPDGLFRGWSYCYWWRRRRRKRACLASTHCKQSGELERAASAAPERMHGGFRRGIRNGKWIVKNTLLAIYHPK